MKTKSEVLESLTQEIMDKFEIEVGSDQIFIHKPCFINIPFGDGILINETSQGIIIMHSSFWVTLYNHTDRFHITVF